MKKTRSVVYFRRKHEGRTDYVRRLSLLKSRLPRLVVRKTNKHMILQVVEYLPDGDKVVCTVTSNTLMKAGWKAATGNSAAAYLTGKLLAKKLKEMKFEKDLIVDIGLQMHKSGSRIYAAVRGVRDGGAHVKCSDDVLPSDERLTGAHLSADVKAQFESMNKKL